MRQAEAVDPEMVRALVAQHPIGRMATVDEIASAAVWLCSPGATYVTAAAIAVDGGFLAA
jgi:NAD(P)-dependent dehydrogenase (short-subunit alcohol dehydrogenase family)